MFSVTNSKQRISKPARSMALNQYFLSFIILVPQISSTGSIQCNNTSDNLTVTAQNKEITPALSENAVISAYINYPKDNVTSVNYLLGDPPIPNPMAWKENCLYSVTVYAINYDYYGINFEGTVIAKSSIRDQQATDFVKVFVQVGTSIVENSTPLIAVRENGNFQINCSATGNPPPTLKWNLENHEDNVEQDQIFQTIPAYKDDISSTTRLRISKVRYNDTGDYQCFGNNTVKDDSKVILQLSVHIPVEFTNSSGIIQIIEGSPIDISCEFRGSPKPDITWGNTNYNVTESVYNDVYTSSTLHITSSKCDDEKQFTCYATNTIVEEGIMNASGNATITFQDPTEVQNLIAKSDECNGTFVVIGWDPIDNWITDITYQIKYSSNGENGTAETEDNKTTITTKPDTEYKINVFAISECQKTSLAASQVVHTGIYLPSEPLHVAASGTASVCTVEWSEPDTTYNNISQYVIYYEACNRDSGCNGNNSFVTCDSLSCEITMTEVNSEYHFEVSAQNCAGAGARANASGECSTDTAATSHITPINPEAIIDSQKTVNGTVIVPFGGFVVNIPEQSQENGDISCYYVVMVRYGNLYDASDQVQNRTIIDPDNLASIADANAPDIKDGQPYFSVASTSFGNVPIGDESPSTCDISRSTKKKYYAALNRNLTADRSYDMFILTTVPSVKNTTEMYSQTSNATFINVVESLPGGRSTNNDDFPVAAVVVPIVLVVLIAAAAGGYWYYREKKKKIAEDSSVSYHHEDVSPYEQTNTSKTRVSPTPSDD